MQNRRARRAAVYVDAFNLYYGCLRSQPSLRWLDLRKLASQLLRPGDRLLRIKYFTASVGGRLDSGAPVRQRAYLRALGSIPGMEVHFGRFQSKPALMPLRADPSRTVWVVRTEEKGSDVSLAVHLLDDAHRDRYDIALVISNDADLSEAIRLARAAGKTVGVANPGHVYRSSDLNRVASFHTDVTRRMLRRSQLPDRVRVGGRVYVRPREWR